MTLWITRTFFKFGRLLVFGISIVFVVVGIVLIVWPFPFQERHTFAFDGLSGFLIVSGVQIGQLAMFQESSDNKQIVQRFMDECWKQGNLNSVSELVAADCRYHDPVFPSLTSGAENIKNHIQNCRNGFPDLMFTIDDTIAERDGVVVHWTATGTHKGQFLGMPPTNKKASVTGTSIFRIEGSKIAEEWANWNLMSMMEQLLGIAMAPQAQSNAPKAESKVQA